MKSKRSRLALMGALALVLSVTVGLVSGSVADAKKKKGGGKGGSVSVSGGPATIPLATDPSPPPPETATTPGQVGFASIPLTVGKKAKNKVVSLDSLSVTYTLTGSAPTADNGGTPGSLFNTSLSITAPNGRTVGLNPPAFFDPNATTEGPITETPDSPFFPCITSVTGPLPSTTICSNDVQQDPEGVLTPPTYAGTQGNTSLALFGGVPAKGTWTVKARNSGTIAASTLQSITLNIGLVPAPTSSSTGGKKKK